jgi:MbtH protein
LRTIRVLENTWKSEMRDLDQRADDKQYQVVVNDEDQHSIWPIGKKIPDGWMPTGFQGAKPDCLKHIAEVWTDITPKSLRNFHRDSSG